MNAADPAPGNAADPAPVGTPATDDATLLNAWRRALPAGTDATLADATGRDLLARWSEPQRHYHTRDHLAFMLSILDAADPSATGTTPAPTAAAASIDIATVRLAAWFHDAVYDPMGTGNERLSADLAVALLPTLRVGQARLDEVVRLVMLTTHHAVTDADANGALLVDADLAILGTPPERYRVYTEQVRAEYAFVPDDAFRAGRSAVLRQLLDLPTLYHLAPHREAWDAQARANMAEEIRALDASGGADPPR